MNLTEAFSRLGIEVGSSKDKIKSAYRQKAKSCHPDLRDDKENATIEFRELTEAFEMALLYSGGSTERRPPPPPPPRRPPPPPSPSYQKAEAKPEKEPPPGSIYRHIEKFTKFDVEVQTFGLVSRLIYVTKKFAEKGGYIVFSINDQKYGFKYLAGTKNGQRFRFENPSWPCPLEIQIVQDNIEEMS